MKKIFLCQKAFTLTEIITALIVALVLMSVAFPRYNQAVEKMRVSEAEHTLLSIFAGQKRYFIDHGSYATDLNQLDITVTLSEYFNTPTAGNPIASVVRKGGSYTLSITDETAKVSCTPVGATCTGLGF